MELVEFFDDWEWEEMLSEFGEFYIFSDEEKWKKSGGVFYDRYFYWLMFVVVMIVYVVRKK